MAASVSAAIDERADIVDDAAGAPAHALEADCHRQADIDVERDFGDAARGPVDVAAGDVVPDLDDREQNREQNGAGVDHARRQVVGAAPQQPARDPERRGGNAVAVSSQLKIGVVPRSSPTMRGS